MKFEYINIDELQLDIENPRIKHYMEMYGDNLTSDQIAYALNLAGGSSSGCDALKESIRIHKGLIQPIIVNRTSSGEMIVVEGNTRLQIFREFRRRDASGIWDKIIAIVHDNLPIEEIHAIRLQTHLVGPRDWDPFSKAKYLDYLSNTAYMPMTTIVSYCGGNTKENEVKKFIGAYQDMMTYYKPLVDEAGDDMAPNEFSKFAESQNPRILRAIYEAGFTKKDFAKWVQKGCVDKALNVRQIPQILKNKKAFEVFKKSNITEAVKIISADEVKEGQTLNAATNNQIVEELIQRLNTIEYSSILELKHNPDFQDEKCNLQTLHSTLKELLEFISESD